MVNMMVHAYNCTRHSSTGYSPYYLLFGREPHLAIDCMLGIDTKRDGPTYKEFVSKWKEQMEQAYAIARDNSQKRKQQSVNQWNQ